MTNSRDEERERRESREGPSHEEDEHREERERRSEDLQEAWRRNHPSEEQQWKGHPGKGGHR